MKRLTYLLAAFTLILFSSCEALKDAASFEKSFTQTLSIPVKSEAGLGTAETAVITSDIKAEMDKNNLSLDKAKANIVELSAKMLTEGAKFGDLSNAEFWIVADGKETKIAFKTTIPEGTGNSLTFDVDANTDLVSMLSATTFKFKMSYQSRVAITKIYDVELTARFKIGPK